MAKPRPKSESEKRFSLSDEEFSKVRLRAVQDEVETIKKKHPEVLSFCMFGSMVKGTAHKGSDIDGWLYIDAEELSKIKNTDEKDLLRYDNGQVYFDPNAIKEYIVSLREGVKARAALEDKDVEHIRSRPISKKIINTEINELVAYYRAKEKYKLDWDKWSDGSPRFATLDQSLEHKRSEPKRPEYRGTNLEGMFHLDVGGGIRKYRKMFIEKLSKLGEDGERIWLDTIKGTEMLEHGKHADGTKRYPRTLAEAEKVYAQ
jgi:predicted nucleotidyltransferase